MNTVMTKLERLKEEWETTNAAAWVACAKAAATGTSFAVADFTAARNDAYAAYDKWQKNLRGLKV